MSDPIKKITLKDGTVRYRFVVDIGRDPATGKRQQKTFTFDTKREARAEYDKTRHKVNEGTYIRPSKVTVGEYLDGWLEGATRDLRASSKRSYRDALRPVREQLGPTPIQKVTKADIERMVTWMQTEGRRRGGKPGTGLGPRSVRLTLGRLTAAFEMATLEGLVAQRRQAGEAAEVQAREAGHLVEGRSAAVPAQGQRGPVGRGLEADAVRAAPR